MTDTVRLAALLSNYARRIEKAKTPTELGVLIREAITEAYGAGVTLAPAEGLREAAQAVVDAWGSGDIEVADTDESWYAYGSLLALTDAVLEAKP
jgi:hypothetical protein